MWKGILLTLAIIGLAAGIWFGTQGVAPSGTQTEYEHWVTITSYPTPADVLLDGVVRYQTPTRAKVIGPETWELRYKDLDPVSLEVSKEMPHEVHVEFEMDGEAYIQKRASEMEEMQEHKKPTPRKIKIEKVN